MTIKALFPTVRPTLSLDFAKTKVLDPRITFTRASTGTYVGADGLIKTAAVNEARFDHNPATGGSLGLLVEEARTNLQTYSEQFNNAAWTKNHLPITANAAIAPDGTTTADKLIEATAATRGNASGVPLTNGDTVSVFAKAAEWTYLALGISNNGGIWSVASFNLANGTYTGTTTYGAAFVDTPTITAVGSGWYRCSVRIASGGGVGNRVTIMPFNQSGDPVNPSPSLVGDGTSGIYVWGAQLEAGAFPTTYIPTTAATVTRAADVVSMTGTNFSSWYNQSQGTLIATTPSGIALYGASNTTYFGISTGAINATSSVGDGIKYGSGSPGTYTRFFVIASSGIQVDSNSAINASKIALAYAINNFAIVRSGSVFTDSSGNVPTGMDTFTIRGQGFQCYSRITYYPVRLPDTQLQALTAT
jgi:hypothetical protein